MTVSHNYEILRNNMHLTILIIEDEPDMATYLKDVLEDNGYTAYTAHQGIAGLQLIEDLKPDLVLLDLELPDIDGRSICQKIIAEHPDIKIIMVTAHKNPSDIAQGLQIGADDYVTKPIDSDELLARINARFRNSHQSSEVITLDDLSLNQETYEVKRGDEHIDLSPQEFKLLQYLLINKGKVLTRNMILSRLWNTNPDIETRVVDVYIGYLRKKIDTKKPKLIHSVRGFGYVIKEPKASTEKQ